MFSIDTYVLIVYLTLVKVIRILTNKISLYLHTILSLNTSITIYFILFEIGCGSTLGHI